MALCTVSVMAYKIPQLLQQYSVSILLVIVPLFHNNYKTKISFSETVDMDKFVGANKSDLTNFIKLAVKHVPGKKGNRTPLLPLLTMKLQLDEYKVC